MQTVNFQAPTDYSLEAEQIARQRKYAELLQQQSLQPQGETQFAGGWAVKNSPFAGMAKMLQAYGSTLAQDRADEKQKALAEKVRQQGMSDVQGFMGALQGKPAQAAIGANEMDFNGTPAAPAVAGDKSKALAIALQSQNPMVAGAGQSILADMLKTKEWSLGERFNEKTGKPEKFMYRKDDPTQTVAMGGQQGVSADTEFKEGGLNTRFAGVSGNTAATVANDRYKWGNISPFQRAELGIQGQNAGANMQRTAFETGAPTLGGGARLPNNQPAPPLPVGGQPPVQAMVPQAAPQAAMPPQAPVPMPPQAAPQAQVPRPAPVAAPADGLTPAARAALAKDKAQKDQDAARDLPKAAAFANQAIQNIDAMIGDVDKGGKKAPHPGFQSVVGATLTPGMRFVPGTDAADFDTRLEQIKGQTFLQAFEALKGGGQITEIEGRKATDALNRMNRAQSEKEFVTAAREFQTQLRLGIDLAAGRAGGAKTSGATGSWDGQDRRTSGGKVRVVDF